MATTAAETPSSQGVQDAEHVDILIIGAGISGIAAAHHARERFGDRSLLILEARDHQGGTWWTHRYPGVRSDSDLFTYGYRFKPWRGPAIATGSEFLSYLDEVIAEDGLDDCIRYLHRVTSASWSTADRRWTVEVTRTDTGERLRFTTGFLWMCPGYYNHDKPYQPGWKGLDRYQGTLVHPQRWPEGLDVTGKRVIVIGSGATAATLIPAIAADCAHVIMLQRSPTYFRTGRNAIEIAETLRTLQVDETWIHEITRRKILHDQDTFTRKTFEEPEAAKKDLLSAVEAYLGPDYDIATHFTPKYRPWRQRIAFIPDGDLFQAIKSGKASVVTDEIDRFTETGILLKSGKTLEADIIVTATGFNLSASGDIEFEIDGKPLDFADTVTYPGMMFTGVPNLVWVFGYFRASWTLRVDLVADFVCRLLKHMKTIGAAKVTPALRAEDSNMHLLP